MIYTDLETGKVMESYQYSYDKNSNIIEKTAVNNYPKEDADKVNETKVYTYDTLGRLTKTVTTDIRRMTRQRWSHIPMIMLETGSKKMTEQQ